MIYMFKNKLFYGVIVGVFALFVMVYFGLNNRSELKLLEKENKQLKERVSQINERSQLKVDALDNNAVALIRENKAEQERKKDLTNKLEKSKNEDVEIKKILNTRIPINLIE